IHGGIDRRAFLERAQKFAVGAMTASMLLASLRPNYAAAQVVPKDDKRIKTEVITYPSPAGSGTMKGYLAMPANATGKLPGILVIHENRGTNPHIEDIARRLALENFIAFAPDALAPLGGYPGDDEKAAVMFRSLDQAKTREDFFAGVGVIKARPEFNGKFGSVGFCYGGGIVHRIAVRFPDLAAGVPFYGPPPPVEDAAKVKAALQMHFAGNDSFVNPTWPPYEAALKAAGVRMAAFTYDGAQHGFNNDTTPRFDAAAAKSAWDRTVAFFNQTLRA
ncbi:MAG: dienelactone hydrolase family protein, partial [Burkholderiaceae bacterium]